MEEYQAKLKSRLEVTQYHKIEYSKAIYFAAYYNPENAFFTNYGARFFLTKNRWLSSFQALWRTYREKELGFDQDYFEQH